MIVSPLVAGPIRFTQDAHTVRHPDTLHIPVRNRRLCGSVGKILDVRKLHGEMGDEYHYFLSLSHTDLDDDHFPECTEYLVQVIDGGFPLLQSSAYWGLAILRIHLHWPRQDRPRRYHVRRGGRTELVPSILAPTQTIHKVVLRSASWRDVSRGYVGSDEGSRASRHPHVCELVRVIGGECS